MLFLGFQSLLIIWCTSFSGYLHSMQCRINILHTIFWILSIHYSCVLLGVFIRRLFEDLMSCLWSLMDFTIDSYPQIFLEISLHFVTELYFWDASSCCIVHVGVRRLFELVAEVNVLKRAYWTNGSSHIEIHLLSNLCSLLKIVNPFLGIIAQSLCLFIVGLRFWRVSSRTFGACWYKLVLFQFFLVNASCTRLKIWNEPIIRYLRWWYQLLRL